MKKMASVLLGLLALGISPSCAQDLQWDALLARIRAEFPGITQISPDSLARHLTDSTTTPWVILDARQPEEYAVSHLPGALRIDPDATDFSDLEVSRSQRVVVYCSVGYRSSALAQRLKRKGWRNVANLEGSIFAWVNAGHPVYRGDEQVQGVHPYDRIWGRLLNKEYRSYKPENQ